jgi:hypothetical protein
VIRLFQPVVIASYDVAASRQQSRSFCSHEWRPREQLALIAA